MAELGIAVVGAFLSALLPVAIDRISTSRKFADLFQGNKGNKFEETLDRLHRTLYRISEVLADAEVKEGAEGVRTWLGKLRAEVNHADDLLDEFNYEFLRLQLDKQTQVDLKSSFKSAFINLKLSLKPSFIKKLLPQLRKVTDTLEDFVNQINELGLQKLAPKEKYPNRAPSSSVVNTSQIFGRDDEKEIIIQRVLSDGGDSNVSVVAITGMGGIGKTTLAQLVYNDDRVKKKFFRRAWVCVSEEYETLRITRALLMEVNSNVVDEKDDFNRLQVKLEDNLKGKSFLIILDDIWNENYNDWDSLKNPLIHGSRGSKIIVTTRNENIASMMQSEPFHHLEPIPEDQSWCLFKSHAFDKADLNSLQKFETIGKDIVRKCNGLPLAIKTVAGALRPKRDIDGWHKFLNSEIWANGGDILPALRLSYKHLPSHLKCCFAFCALFPKDIPFEKDEVVLLWMANDLVKPSTQKDGREYFEELKSRSFFDSVKQSFFDSVNGKWYLMHDLINDLARSVTGNTCIRLEDYEARHRDHSIQRENGLPPELLHFSYLTNSWSETSKMFKGLSQVHGLRTFLSIHQDQYWCYRYKSTISFSDMFPRFQRLRALNLSRHDISMVPDSIGDLKHLRFLNLAATKIKRLPKAICKCLNLQTLVLTNCQELVELPEEMRLLINLQLLDVRSVGEPLIKTMATWLRMFKDIQNISVVVDKIQGSELELLVRLQVYDSLNIIGLGDTDVATIERAKRVGLIDKYYIKDLTLEWGDVVESSQEELNKFVKLQPHTNTKKLSIKGYTGSIFPDWLGNSAFTNMKSLSISDCNNIMSFPEGGLAAPNLKELIVEDCKKMKSLPARMHTLLPLLTWLSIEECPEIECFPEGGLPSSLKSLVICECSKMKSLPARMHTQLPLLTYLRIEECPEIECFPQGSLPSSLETLHIEYCSKIRNCQTNWGLQTLPALKVVHLGGFEDTLFPEGLLPTTLQELWIREFSNLESLNEEGLQHLSSLQTLFIIDFPKLQYLPQQKFSSSLSKLNIYRCDLLESFPEGLASSLSELYINKCPKLAGCVEREKGEDWPKVSHIPKIEVLSHRVDIVEVQEGSSVVYTVEKLERAFLQVIEEISKIEMIVNVKRGEKEAHLKVEVHKKNDGSFHLNHMKVHVPS